MYIYISLSQFSKYMSLIFSFFTGYRQKDGAKGKNFNETCEICRPGSYGSEPDRSVCKICRGGVICLEGVQTFVVHLFSFKDKKRTICSPFSCLVFVSLFICCSFTTFPVVFPFSPADGPSYPLNFLEGCALRNITGRSREPQ